MIRHGLFHVVAAGAMVAAGCTAIAVHPVVLDGRAVKTPDHIQGVYYSLPRTIIAVSLPVTTTSFARGHLWPTDPALQPEFIAKLRNAGVDVPEKLLDHSTYEAPMEAGAPEISSRSVPDGDQVFLVEPKGGWLQDRSLLVELTEAGVITTGSASVRDRTVEFAVKIFKAVASAAGAALGTNAAGTAAFIEKTAALTPELVDQILKQIKSLRDKRGDLVSSAGAAMNRDTLERMLAQLDVIERQLIAYFYTVSVRSELLNAELDPSSDNLNFPVFANLNCSVVIDYDGGDRERGRIAAIRRTTDLGAAECAARGFYYRVPASCRVSLYRNESSNVSRLLARRAMPIAQLGTVAALPAGVSSSDIRTAAVFSPESGALRKYEIESKSLDPALVDELSAALTSLASAKAARDAAQASEPGRLERAQAKLKTLQDILALFGVSVPGAGGASSDAAAEGGGD